VVRELRRVLRPGGDLGLLVFVARGPLPGPLPEGNDFPPEDALCGLLDGAGFAVEQTMESDGLAQAPHTWQERADAVAAWLAEHHGDDPRWRRAEEQTARIARLIGGGHVRPLLVHARAE
jgi:SAM-dependent methyltransferase